MNPLAEAAEAQRLAIARYKDRSAKVLKRRQRMPVNGFAFKRLLIDRAAKAQKEKR